MSPIDPTEPQPPIEPRRCKARKSNGQPCRNSPVNGAEVCRFHGGAAPQVRAAAERRIAEQRAIDAARLLGVPVETTPHEAILGHLWRCVGTVTWLRQEIATQDRLHDVNLVTGVAEPSVYARLLDTWETHLRQAAVAAARMGIEDRQVRLAEEQGRVVADLLRALVDRYVPEGEQGDARRFIAGQLRAIGGTAA